MSAKSPITDKIIRHHVQGMRMNLNKSTRAAHHQTATALDALMPALLDQAFRGEL
jgi:hypothetical protein